MQRNVMKLIVANAPALMWHRHRADDQALTRDARIEFIVVDALEQFQRTACRLIRQRTMPSRALDAKPQDCRQSSALDRRIQPLVEAEEMLTEQPGTALGPQADVGQQCLGYCPRRLYRDAHQPQLDDAASQDDQHHITVPRGVAGGIFGRQRDLQNRLERQHNRAIEPIGTPQPTRRDAQCQRMGLVARIRGELQCQAPRHTLDLVEQRLDLWCFEVNDANLAQHRRQMNLDLIAPGGRNQQAMPDLLMKCRTVVDDMALG